MKNIHLIFALLVLAFACSPKPDLTKAKEEIRTAEAAFNQAAKEIGIAEAFYEFAAEGATINYILLQREDLFF